MPSRTLPLLLALAVACKDRDEGSDDPVGDDDDDTDLPPGDDDDDDTVPPTETDPPACGIVAASAARGALPLEQVITVATESPGPVWATCTSPTVPEELHLVEGASEGGLDARLVVRGLLGNTAYDCVVHAQCGGEPTSVAFTTPVPGEVPMLTATLTPGSVISGAYTLISNTDCPATRDHVVFVDPDGKYRWVYDLGDQYRTDIDATLIDSETLHLGGGWGLMRESLPNRGIFRTMDLSGNVSIERTLPAYGLGFNHHSQPLPDGSYLGLVGSTDTNGVESWTGVGVEIWHPTQGLLWTWNSQRLVDLGQLGPPVRRNELPYHANAAEVVSDVLGDAIWISDYGDTSLWRIDRATGERTHRFGPNGDFQLYDALGSRLPTSQFPYVQHAPDWFPDSSRVLLYDNGYGRPGGPGGGDDQSRVAEYGIDLVRNKAVLRWTWTEPGFSNPVLGDADWLPNGNVLVTQGFSQCWGDEGDVSELVEITPPVPGSGDDADVVWRLTWPSDNFSIYRSQRYDGCDLFHNARYCSVVASRIAELDALTPEP